MDTEKKQDEAQSVADESQIEGKTEAFVAPTEFKSSSDDHESEKKDVETSKYEETSAVQPAESKPAPAHYEADVSHYARYDKVDSGYSETTRKSLSYAAQTPFVRFFGDLIMVLTRPGAFWKAQDEHPATTSQLYWPHLTVLVLLRTAAIMGGGAFQHALNDVPLVQLLVIAGIQALMIYILVWILAMLISGISTLSGAGFQFDRAQKFVGYSLTPILVVGILSLIPLPYVDTVCDLIAMPWAFLVIGAGVLPYLKLKPEQGPVLTGLFCGLLLTLWGLVPILIPRWIGMLFA
ncbi:MAG: YIP1 family protein [Proteobacteria bacterium]|nr:YIP1 family protein [Pseudomonadota bacterium]